LEKTDLYITENNIGLLVVNDEEYEIYNSLELLSNVYTVAKKMYPQLASVIVLQGDVYQLLKQDYVEIHDIKIKN
jgi:hypothetical protein